MRRSFLVPALLALGGCIDVPWAAEPDAPVGATQVEAFPPGTTLAEGLDMITAVLDSAAATRLDDAGVANLRRAGSLTDRVLETELPFAWLSAQHYSVEARVWQLQAQADRIIARLRAGARREDLLPDVEALRRNVATLRAALEAGGAPEPAPIEKLLQQLDSVTRRRS